MAAVLMCFSANAQEGFGGVTCQWHAELGQYLCEGTGNRIVVTGGAEQSITNMFGGCTNCVDMTPAQCQSLKDTLLSGLLDIYETSQEVSASCVTLHDTITEEHDDISTFRRFSSLPQSAVGVDFESFSNYVWTVDNSQTELCRSNWRPTSSTLQRYIISYNNGIYDYAQTLDSSLSSQLRQVESIDLLNQDIAVRSVRLRESVADNLNCSACPAGSGSTNDCNCSESTGGRWCTEEQGEAIIELLTDTKDYVERMKGAVISISNNVESAVQLLQNGLFSSYTHVPTEEELGMKWQDLYLDGYSSNFEAYASTNILARIELLLAGMSGVLTNSSDFAASGDFADSGMASTNDVELVVSDFTNAVADVIEQRERNVRSVGDSLLGLYEAFRGWSGTPFSRATLVNSYSVEIGDQHWDVPAFEPSENGLWVANLIRVVCRSVMSIIYILFTIAVFIRFHIAYFQWVLKYLKWVVELMQGLFA